jgi:hypothetical protein
MTNLGAARAAPFLFLRPLAQLTPPLRSVTDLHAGTRPCVLSKGTVMGAICQSCGMPLNKDPQGGGTVILP